MFQREVQSASTNQPLPCDIVIGCDFGTSCTKVVLQSPDVADGRAMVVCFGELGHPINNHLLPTRLYYDSKGICSLSATSNSFCATGLKLKLLQQPDEAEVHSDFKVIPITLAIAYLALLFRIVRAWFFETQEQIYGQFRIRWQCNLGIPSPGYRDEEERELFRLIAVDGWRFSLGDAPVSLEKIWRYFVGEYDSNHKLDIHVDDIQVVPEVVAEVTGYARSHQRENGLHVLIDIGASTVDICGFNLFHREGEDRYAILTSDLAHLGAFHCHRERVRRIREYFHRWFAHLATRTDLILPVDASLSEYFPIRNDFGPNAEKEILEEFYHQCFSLIHRTLRFLKKERDPLSDRWKTGLPIFLCGGGKSLEIYQNVLEHLNQFWCTSMATRGFKLLNLPAPSSLIADDIETQCFDRFAVAYGLSFRFLDIGEVRAPFEIENVAVDQKLKYEGIEYVSKDMV